MHPMSEPEMPLWDGYPASLRALAPGLSPSVFWIHKYRKTGIPLTTGVGTKGYYLPGGALAIWITLYTACIV